MPVVEVRHLTKRYRGRATAANDDISLTIEQGEFLGIFGPNGAGKTTLVKQLTGLLRPTSGVILLDGLDVIARREVVPLRVGYYGQKVAALRHHTVREVLVFTGCLRGMAYSYACRRADDLLDRFSLQECANRRLSKLSGGEQRLAVLLATFVGAPRILVLDEPTNELDPVRRKMFWDYLGGYADEYGATVILTTHNLAEAEAVIGTAAIINDGKLLAKDSLGAMKRNLQESVRLVVQTHADVDARLGCYPGSRRLHTGQWEICAPRQRADALLTDIVDLVGLENLDDFRMATPTLEDIYLAYSGGAGDVA